MSRTHMCVFGMQRRRTAEDELNMRTVYAEGDLISVSTPDAGPIHGYMYTPTYMLPDPLLV